MTKRDAEVDKGDAKFVRNTMPGSAQEMAKALQDMPRH